VIKPMNHQKTPSIRVAFFLKVFFPELSWLGANQNGN